MTTSAQAKALDPLAILVYLTRELAIPLSTLSKKFDVGQDRMKSSMADLADKGLVRIQGVANSPATVYSITENGARVAEGVKKGISAYF